MIGNYPDGLSESNPGAPWNQPDAEPLICVDCHGVQPESAAEGGECEDCGSPNLREQEACPNCGRPETRCCCDE